MMKKIGNMVLWLLLLAWFPVISGFVRSEADHVLCRQIHVEISDTLSSRFVLEPDVRTLFANSGIDLQGYPIGSINTRELEALLEESPYVNRADVSTDVSGTLTVSLDQRVPLLRLMPVGDKAYYMDDEGRSLPLCRHYVPHILVASGYMSKELRNDDSEASRQLYEFCSYLSGHSLWQDQIVQLYVDKKGSWELVPRVGAHQILFGDLDDWPEKMEKLELLYKQGLPEHGWNTFSLINLKYENQVICTKR